MQVEPKVGGKFSIYGGSVEATFTALQEPSQIDMDWRFRNWPDGSVSKVHAASHNMPNHLSPVLPTHNSRPPQVSRAALCECVHRPFQRQS